MTSAPSTPDDAPKFRYTGALAQEIERRWQDTWDADGHVRDPESRRAAGRSRRRSPGSRRCSCSTCSRTRRGTGLHVGHPLGFIGTDIYSRYKRMTGHNVMYTMGFDAFGLPAEQYAVQTGQHPAITTDAERRQLPPAAATTRSEPRRTPQHQHHRPGLLPLDAVDLPADLQLVVRHRGRQGPTDQRADRSSTSRAVARPTTAGRGPISRRPSATRSSTTTAWPTSATRRSTGAPASARSSPTRRSPPTVAATAATSRCSSATCASG